MRSGGGDYIPSTDSEMSIEGHELPEEVWNKKVNTSITLFLLQSNPLVVVTYGTSQSVHFIEQLLRLYHLSHFR